MKLQKLGKFVGGVVVAGVLSASANANLLFTVDETILFGGGSIFDSEGLSGIASTLVQPTSGTTINGSGWVNVNSYNLGAFQSAGGIGSEYRIWGEYSYDATFIPGSGAFGTAVASYDITTFDFSLYAGDKAAGEPGFIFAQSDGTAASVDKSVFTLDTDLFVLGTGSLFGGLPSTITSGTTGGAPVNVNGLFSLTDAGRDFFVAPEPFYDSIAANFNNTIASLEFGEGVIAVRSDAGITFANVPAPATLALLGMGLLGLRFRAAKR